MSRTRAVLTATLLASALALGGCSDDDPTPKFAPSESPSATISSGAEFVRSYFRLIDRATRNGKTSSLLAASSPSCSNCTALAKNIEDAFSDGKRVDGASWEVVSVEEVGPTAGGAEWNVDVRTSEERWYDDAGRLVKTVKPSTQHFGVIVRAGRGSAEVVDMKLRS